MEYLREKQSLESYGATLSRLSDGFGRRVALLEAQNGLTAIQQERNSRRLGRLKRHLHRITGEVEILDLATSEGIFLLPDNKELAGVSPAEMGFLGKLAPDLMEAQSSSSLPSSLIAREGALVEDQRLAFVSSLNGRLSPLGWGVGEIDVPITYGDGRPSTRETYYYLEQREVVPAETANLLVVEEPAKEAVVEKIVPIVVPVEFKDAELVVPDPSLEGHRKHAEERFGLYLETPDEVARDHQVDVVQSAYDNFRSGKTSGTIVLPTGSGKTYVAALFAKILGVPTVVFSTTRDIMAQNGGTIAKVCPDFAITEFHGNKKDTSGLVVNTLYQSFPALAASGLDFGRFGLVIYDEADLSLGEERHKIHDQFPNAIKIALTATPYYDQLDDYIERGIVNPEAEWVQTFRNVIHEMSPEEAYERGIIPQLDFYLLGTGMRITGLKVGAGGDFKPEELEKRLNKKARNAITIACIAGLEYLPKGVTLDEKLEKKIKKIHSEVKGKRALIHGINVKHILDLEEELVALGISAKAIYGDMTEDRQAIIKAVRTGEIQVLLGDQLTGRGLDIPELVASFHLSPTLSGRELTQEVGRLFRHSPETGKEKGIVVQLVDKYEGPSVRRPLLAPEIFQPGFVARGIARSNAPRQERGSSGEARSLPSILIDGNIDLIGFFEEVKLQDLLQSRFRDASIEQMNEIILASMNNIMQSQYGKELSLYEVYTKLVQSLPSRVSSETNQKTLNAIESDKAEYSALGTQVLMALNLKTIMGVLEGYVEGDLSFDNELLHHVLDEVSRRVKRFHNRYAISIQLSTLSHQAARRFISSQKQVPIYWIQRDIHRDIELDYDNAVKARPFGLGGDGIYDLAEYIAEKYEVPAVTVRGYISKRLDSTFHDEARVVPEDTTIKDTQDGDVNRELGEALEKLTEREQRVLYLRFTEEQTLAEIGKEFGVKQERIRQIEAKALRKLRRNLRPLRRYI